MNKLTANLLIVAFGGPTPGCCHKFDPCPGEAYCFVSGIFGDNPARKARVDEVVEHYKDLGGYSRFNEITEAQADALKAELARRGHDVNITVGYDHWNPYIRDKVAGLPAGQDFIALVLAPHQSSVSWDGYLRRISEGLEALPEDSRPNWTGVCEPFYSHTGFIDALADHIRQTAGSIGADLTAADTGLLLSAHAVPMPVVRTSPYVDQIKETAELVARKLKARNWMVGFQSAPTDSRIDWTTPYVETVMEQLNDTGVNKIVAAPVGFLCDNVEVLHDLGVEGREKAKELGIEFATANAVNTHPAFIAALADRVEAALEAHTT